MTKTIIKKSYLSQNYRDFLVKFLNEKGIVKGINSYLANILNSSTSLISHIFSDKRQLSMEQAFLLIRKLEMSSQEQELFLALLQFERSGSYEMKKYYEERIDELREKILQVASLFKENSVILSDEIKFIYYSDWSFSAVRILSTLPIEKTPESFSKFLNLPLKRIEEIINFLLTNKICVLINGKLENNSKIIYLDKLDPLIKQRQISWRLKAIESMDKGNSENINLTFPLSISTHNRKKVNQIIIEATEKIKNLVNDEPPEEFCCLNIDWFQIK